MEVQRKDEAQQGAGMFGTPSRRAVVGAGCAVALGVVATGTGLGAYMENDDPLTDKPHGRGNATGAYAADDVILSMCNNCNTYCTIKVRVVGEGEEQAAPAEPEAAAEVAEAVEAAEGAEEVAEAAAETEAAE